MATNTNDPNKPVRFKASRRSLVTASVFTNERTAEDGSETVYHSVTLQAAYTDKTNTWKHTNTIPARDLDDALVALQKAKAHIESLEAGASHTDETPKLTPKERSKDRVSER